MLGIKILVGVISLPILALGIRTMIMPMSVATKFGIESQSTTGLTTLRAVVGGYLLGCALMVLMGVAILGRLIGLALDEFSFMALPPIIFEMVVVGIMFLGHGKLFRDKL